MMSKQTPVERAFDIIESRMDYTHDQVEDAILTLREALNPTLPYDMATALKDLRVLARDREDEYCMPSGTALEHNVADMLEELWHLSNRQVKRNGELTNQVDKLLKRNAELENICKLGARMRMTPIVDDDFPEVAHEFDSAMKAGGFYED